MTSYLIYKRTLDFNPYHDEKGRFADKNGKPLTFYHGSEFKFDKFAHSTGVGFHFGTERAAHERTGGRGVIYKAHLKGTNVLELNRDLNDWDGTTVVNELERMGLLTKEQTKPYWDYRNSGGEMSHEKYDSPVNSIVRNILLNAGYNTITYPNAVEDPGSTSYMVLNPEQIEMLK